MRVRRPPFGLGDALGVEQVQARDPRDRVRRLARDDTEIGLRLRQRDFHVQPRLPPCMEFEGLAKAKVVHACRGGAVVAHVFVSSPDPPSTNTDAPESDREPMMTARCMTVRPRPRECQPNKAGAGTER